MTQVLRNGRVWICKDDGVRCFSLSASNGERAGEWQGLGSHRDIRKALIEADLVDCMVALPGQLFYSTQIPVCLWFEVKRNALDATSDSRLFDGETELSLVA